MAEISLIVRRWILSINDDGSENCITFDGTIRESHTAELSVTDAPIETGVVISDHAFMQPRKLTIEGAISDTPIVQSGGAIYRPSDGPVSQQLSTTFDYRGSGVERRSVNAWARLLQIQAAAVPIDVQSGLELYRNMMILRLAAEQDKDTAGALFFTADLRQILFATSQTVTYSPRAPKRAQPKKKLIEKKPEEPTPPQAKKVADSFAIQGLDALGVTSP